MTFDPETLTLAARVLDADRERAGQPVEERRRPPAPGPLAHVGADRVPARLVEAELDRDLPLAAEAADLVLDLGDDHGVGDAPGGVGVGRPERGLDRGLERLALAAPRRAVATGVPRRRAGRPPVLAPRLWRLALRLLPFLPLLPGTRLFVLFGRPAARQQRFDVLPGHARVVEAHRNTVSNTCSITQVVHSPNTPVTSVGISGRLATETAAAERWKDA